MGFLRGQPDWSHAQARTFTGSGESDLEQSARRWWPYASIITGEVHFFDDFEASMIHWNKGNAGGGSLPVLDTAEANSGNQSVKLVTSGAANSQSHISRFMDMPFDNLIGVTCWIKPPNNLGYFEMTLTVYRNLTSQEYRVQYDFGASKIVIRTGGVYTDLVNPANFVSAALGFHMVQMTIDADAKTYRAIRIGSFEQLTNAPSATDAAGTQLDEITLQLKYLNASGSAGTMWVDDCIITRKQP